MKKLLAIIFVGFALSSVSVPAGAQSVDGLDYPDWAKCALDPRGSDYC